MLNREKPYEMDKFFEVYILPKFMPAKRDYLKGLFIKKTKFMVDNFHSRNSKSSWLHQQILQRYREEIKTNFT
jgi:hypothetical protein